MHAIKGSWIGQTFALATSHDAGGKKSRIRRSKEERKTMVESFIKKYQKSNDGNFPSLNLTHKEVGGSFYTVREIVREIIQENRVLAPPKGSLAEQDHSGFLEQPHLGFISLEHKKDLSASDKLHIATSIIIPNQYQVTSGELNSNSSLQFLATELNDEQNCNALNLLDKRENVCEEASHLVPKHNQDARIEEVSNFSGLMSPSRSDEFEDEKIVNRGEGLENDIDSGKTPIKNGVPIHNQENDDESTLQSSDEQYPKKSEKAIDKTKEGEQEVYTVSLDKETLSSEEVGVKYAEPCSAETSSMNVGSMVEAFPLRPVSRTILDSDGESGNLLGADETSEDGANKHDNIAFVISNTDLINAKSEEIILDTTLKSNDKRNDEKVALNLHEPSSGNSALSGNDVGDANDPMSKNSLSTDTKVSISSRQVMSKDSSAAAVESNSREKNGLKKMNRINLETWEGTSKKSTKPESNPVLVLVKAFISAFVKFWSE